jgi:sRNA-binding protein
MAIESINREFEVFMRDMMKAQECAHENIEAELRSLIRTTVNSCATMYGFSAKEALSKLDSNGNLLPQISKVPNEEKPRVKEAEKAEKARVKELEKAEKARVKELEKAQKELEKTEALRRKEFEKAKKNKLKEFEKTEKANELSERNQMKEQDIASKAIEKQLSLKKKKTVTKQVEVSDYDSDASTVIMTDSEDEEIHILFQNLPLIEEINLIRNIKVQKKLSAGVKLARQVLDI